MILKHTLFSTASVAVFFRWFAVVVLLSGCVTHESTGDKEYTAGNYKEALENYNIVISEGSEDPKVFAKAARAAFQLGNFASAERFYSRSLSFGADLQVARELARLYVQTSNYRSAVRVYQYLLEREKDPQPVYNNIGTALMYAGSPMDAESYLMIAQQLDPKDPLPYVNLGLLYDQHLKQPWRSAAFYRCFEELAPNHDDQPMVGQRRSELESKYPGEIESFECGQAYEPPAQPVVTKADLRARLKKVDEKYLIDGTPTDVNPSVIDLNAEEVKINEPPKRAKTATDALIAYRKGDFTEAKKVFETLPVSEFDAERTRAFGDTLVQLGSYVDAERWLEMSIGYSDTPRTVALLIGVLKRNSKTDRRTTLCGSYAGRVGYESLKEPCADVIKVKAVDPDSKETTKE